MVATAGDVLWEQFLMRLHTAVGQVRTFDLDLLPYMIKDSDRNFVLSQNQALLAQIVAPAGASNPATNHYMIGCVWEEN
jgi:hypothetical protein